MTDTRHLAQKRFGANGNRLYCKRCDWVATAGLSEREQREEHRQHRRDEGEEVQGISLKLDQHERIKYLRLVHAAVRTNLSVDAEGNVTRGEICQECRKKYPCLTARIVDGEAEALADIQSNDD